MWHVFEHLEEPAKTLSVVQKILKKDGHLFLSIPNISSWDLLMFKGHWFHLDPPRHLFFMDSHSLIRIFSQYGFKLVSKSYFSIEHGPIGFQQSFLNTLFEKRELLYEALKGNKDYVKDSSRWSLWFQMFFWIGSFPLFIAVAMVAAICDRGSTVEFHFQLKQDS